MKKIFGISSDIILGLIIVFILAVVGFYVLNSVGSLKTTVCISPSMEPTIMTNGLVVTDSSVPYEDIEVGDIIMVDEGYGRLVNHRVHQISYSTGAKTILTAGDNKYNLVDPWVVTETDYKGEVVNYANFPRFLIWVLQGDITEQTKGEITSVDIEHIFVSILVVLVIFILLNFSLLYHTGRGLLLWSYVGLKNINKKIKGVFQMNNSPEIWFERRHGRTKKNTQAFKGVVNGVIVSSLVLSAVLSSSTPAVAAEKTIKDIVNGYETQTMQEYGVSLEEAIQETTNTINVLFQMKSRGVVSDSDLKTLASQIYMLEQAAKGNSSKETIEKVKVVLDNAEKAVAGLKNEAVKDVNVAIAFARYSLGLENKVEIKQSKAANTSLKSFSDVPRSHWAYTAIMEMVKRGMIAGTTTPDANGVGTFAPNATMTKAQFITVVTRYLYPNDLKNYASSGGVWYAANYDVAVVKGLIKENEFPMDNMNKPMTRQEMSLVLVRAMEQLGEEKGTLISTSRIPDYNKIGTYYRNFVQVAYSKGLICGTDSAGTFNPMGTLNRAQAATVLYRLVAPETRAAIDLGTPTVKEELPPATGSQVFHEGEKHNKPQAGDVVIKTDGTRVTIKYDEYGILRAEGCDIYSGTVVNGVTVKEGMASYYDQRPFRKDSITGEMLSVDDWNTLRGNLNPTGKYVGDYDGEILNTWYKWSAKTGLWLWTGPAG